MFRAFLTCTLMAIFALPQGICVCHYLHATPFDEPHDCAEPHSTSGGEHSDEPADDHDDCDCKLRDDLTYGAVGIHLKRDKIPSFDGVADSTSAISTTATACFYPFHAHHNSDHSIPLILCALRI